MGCGPLRSLRLPTPGPISTPDLRDTARAMSQENVEIVRAMFEDFLAGATEYDADGVYVRRRSPVPSALMT